MKHLASSITLAVLLMSRTFPVSGETVVQTGQTTVEVKTYEILDKDAHKVTFDKGSAFLKADERTKLLAFINQSQGEPRIDRYIIAAWSDKPFPTDQKKLHKVDNKLAADRAQEVEDAIKAAGPKNLDSFLMTKKPNWIQKAFSTETAEIKGEGKLQSNSARVYDKIGERIRDIGGPGTVVIVAKYKHEVATM